MTIKESTFASLAEIATASKCRWRDLYHEVELYKCAVRLYTKPLFSWRKEIGRASCRERV